MAKVQPTLIHKLDCLSSCLGKGVPNKGLLASYLVMWRKKNVKKKIVVGEEFIIYSMHNFHAPTFSAQVTHVCLCSEASNFISFFCFHSAGHQNLLVNKDALNSLFYFVLLSRMRVQSHPLDVPSIALELAHVTTMIFGRLQRV